MSPANTKKLFYKTTVSLMASTHHKVNQRRMGNNRSAIIDRDLSRYYSLIEELGPEIAEEFNEAEKNFLRKFLFETNNRTAGAKVLRSLIPPTQANKPLLAKLSKLDSTELTALFDFVETP